MRLTIIDWILLGVIAWFCLPMLWRGQPHDAEENRYWERRRKDFDWVLVAVVLWLCAAAFHGAGVF